jgi:hypothetical protein
MTPAAILSMIKCQVLLKKDELHHQGAVSWELTLMVPLELFYHHQWTTLKGKIARINFYKCGDELPQPHFLSWMPIDSAEPDFHLPEFFGELKFI